MLFLSKLACYFVGVILKKLTKQIYKIEILKKQLLQNFMNLTHSNQKICCRKKEIAEEENGK